MSDCVSAEHHRGGLPAAPSVPLQPDRAARAGGRHGLQAPLPGLPQRQVLPLHRQLVPAGGRREEEERGHARHHGQDR